MKKIIETLKRKWAEYLLEILVIMIGIIGAFALNNWNENRLSKKTEKAILNSLVKDLEVDHLRYQRLDSLYQGELAINKEFNSLIKQTSFSDHELLLISQFWGVTVREINPRLMTYEEMVNSGKIYTLTNNSLVNEIIEYYRILKDVELDTSEERGDHYASWRSRDFIEFWHMKNVARDLDEMKKIAEVLLINKNGDDYKHL